LKSWYRSAHLGGDRKKTDATTGTLLMGVRGYQPLLGRFVQRDPVERGSANAYDYVNQDPINGYDLDGRFLGRFGNW
jgi:RHS repeat-associated protein